MQPSGVGPEASASKRELSVGGTHTITSFSVLILCSLFSSCKVGSTPFGPFSQSRKLSFAQRDAVGRHLIYRHINATLSRTAEYFHTFAVRSASYMRRGPFADRPPPLNNKHKQQYDLELEDALSPDEFERLMHVWHLFLFKLDEVPSRAFLCSPPLIPFPS